ncbi:uncharacterized protein LAESUDRAFT_657779 [Laetiporus sulphureus 93-53]|uniref:Uncharacterized protein n=1 Tax=Laetiporus sulphureus 93-53 TaxID=1314785 RepID=A0A165DAT2_9APHY|nr:uncharacterized protein LAESUDRAFT_657779 [Laetiporus sulphureus 93-53]KZT04449.1 hypothetical protein LAESUDRAFT_657779 [Laetiporus sulphureus 93-53]
MHLSFPGAARLLVKLRRLRHPRPCIHLQSSSGPGPQTDWSLADELADEPNDGSVSEGGHGMGKAAVSRRCIPLIKEYTFVCRDGVDTARLLRLVRAELLEQAKTLGGSVLVDEQWSCTICGPRDDGRTFKVHIRYAASAARSARPDPQSPVAIEHAKGIPGLMTILDREECF